MADNCPYVSRGGLKLRHALVVFGIDAAGLTCADLGASTGGFTDCLLQAGALRVYSVDTAYGQLAWTLRNDPRVTVTERTNALHARPPADGTDLVVVDLGWTPQRLAVPAALCWLKPGGLIISLIKPHYELKALGEEPLPRGGVLEESRAQKIVDRVLLDLPALGARVLGVTRSPILGGALKSGKAQGHGNAEWLALLTPGRAAIPDEQSPAAAKPLA